MYNEVISLISTVKTKQPNGDFTETETIKEVFAKAKSVGMKEMYSAHIAGLRPEYTFEIQDYLDYDNQDQVEFNGERFRIFRTYRKTSNELEIVVTR